MECTANQLVCKNQPTPDISRDALVRVVDQAPGLDLVEGAASQVLLGEAACHVVPPIQRQSRLPTHSVP